MPETYGHEVGEERALLTLQADFDEPVNVLDRSSNYGLGQSEERIGAVTRERDSLPEGFVVSTNLDRDSDTRRRLADGLTPEKLKHVAILTAPALCRLRAAKGLAWIEDFTGRKHLVEG